MLLLLFEEPLAVAVSACDALPEAEAILAGREGLVVVGGEAVRGDAGARGGRGGAETAAGRGGGV